MSTARKHGVAGRIGAYPLEFARIFIRAIREPVVLELSSSDEAKRFRDRLYSFRRYLEPLERTATDRETLLAMLFAPAARMTIDEQPNGAATLTIYYEPFEEHNLDATNNLASTAHDHSSREP